MRRKKSEEAESKERKQEGQFGDGRVCQGSRFLFFFFSFPFPRRAVFQSCAEPVAISVRRRRSGLGMDAITLQEKLVERLLCPRGRTARQKVKEGSCLEMEGWMGRGGGAPPVRGQRLLLLALAARCCHLLRFLVLSYG